VTRKSESGFEIPPVYGPGDVADGLTERLGEPGEFPYTRGVYSTMYTERPWTMRQYAGFGTAAESNARYHQLLKAGTMGLSVAFDLPTQMGMDSDAPLAHGEVGKVGVAIDSVDDMRVLLGGIPLDSVSTSMTINAPASLLLLLYQLVAEEQGVPVRELNGTIQNDVLKEYIARGTYIFPPSQSLRLITDTFAYCKKEIPRWNTISISGYHMAEAGATPAQEVAFTLADGVAYVEAALHAGLAVDDFAPRLAFFFVSRTTFLEEVAKFRAARRIWARIMRDRFGAQNPRSQMLRFHTQTAGVQLTAQQPEVNLVRVSVQALAAVLGGTQSLHTNSFDEALALPTEHAVKIALRTQQVIAHETGVVNAIDPLGGSYYLEELTNRLEAEAYDYFGRIRELGGVIAAIKENFFQREIAEASFRYQTEVESGQRVIVGVNRYEDPDEKEIEILAIDRALEQKQVDRVQALRARRDSAAVEERLARLKRDAAEDSINLMPAIIDASKAYVTMGEMCDALRDVWGTWRETPVF
jgi:methylmalonyl-CoA mutase N-terminal domain/subunit